MKELRMLRMFRGSRNIEKKMYLKTTTPGGTLPPIHSVNLQVAIGTIKIIYAIYTKGFVSFGRFRTDVSSLLTGYKSICFAIEAIYAWRSDASWF